MSSKTTNYNLHKIDLSDAPPDITVLNQNWDVIDTELKRQAEATPDVSGQIAQHDSDDTAHGNLKAEVRNKAPMYEYGTTDLTAGTSPLATGKLYFVYE